MRVLAVVSTKGGSGKSSLAFALTVEALRRGVRAVLIDADPAQRTASLCAAVRDREPAVPVVVTADPFRDVPPLADRYALAILDAGGHDSPGLRLSLLAADEVLCPVRPGPGDLWALADLFAVLDQLAELRDPPPVALVLNQVPPGGLAAEVRELLAAYRDRPDLRLLDVTLGSRVVWPRATGAGLSPAEVDPTSLAARELELLASEVL